MRGEGDAGRVTAWEAEAYALSIRHARGLTRIEKVTDDILRVRFSPSGIFTPRRSWAITNERELERGASLRVGRDSGALEIDAGAARAQIDRGTGALSFRRAEGQPCGEDLAAPAWRTVSPEELSQRTESPPGQLPAAARLALSLDKRMRREEAYLSFGQRLGPIDRRYRRLSHWTVDTSAPGTRRGHDNLYQAQPCFLAVRPGLAWGLFLNCTAYSVFDVGAAREDVLRLFALGGELDYYLFTGPTPAAVIEQLTRLTGRPFLPPLWALGYHQSRWSYASAGDVERIERTFRARRIPLDAVHLDIDYMRGYRVFTWDPRRFPNPSAALARLHAGGVRAVVIIDPGVKNELDRGYAVADEGVARDAFLRTADGELFTGHVWPGECLFPDFARSWVRRWWGEQHRGLLRDGVDGFWVDMNEPVMTDRPIGSRGAREQPPPLDTPQGEGAERTHHAEVHNLYGHLMARATYMALARERPDRRPWVLTRSAFVGTQRYAASWMGDNHATWEDLEASLPQLMNVGLSGMPHVGVDIGGFYGDSNPELFARWMELGAFYPFMRCHTAKGTRAQEPWSFGPKVEAAAREAIELRYRLLPYLYTLAHLCHRTGAPLLRPLAYDFPEQPALYHVADQAMVGPSLLIAPVLRPGVQRRLVELPAGIWHDFWTGARVRGGSVVREAPLGCPPLFVRAGSLLTLGNVRQSTTEPLAALTLDAYPAACGEWTLIEDDGESVESVGDAAAEHAETVFGVAARVDAITVAVGAREGRYRPHPRRLTLRVHCPRRPASIQRDGAALEAWDWDPDIGCAAFGWPDDGRAHRVVVALDASYGSEQGC